MLFVLVRAGTSGFVVFVGVGFWLTVVMFCVVVVVVVGVDDFVGGDVKCLIS